MSSKLWHTSAIVLCALPCLNLSSGAIAQDYPAKAIRVVVPWPPGGSSDTLARILGQHLSGRLGQQVVIDNRPGAGTTIGNEVVAKAQGDGYTLMVTATALVASSALYPNLTYRVDRDFVPISLAATAPSVLVTHPSLPAKSVSDLIALARANPRQINYASGGSGSSDHIAAELFKMLTRIDITHIPYKGATPALIDLIAGNTQLMFCIAITAMPHVRTGKLRALGITSAKRSELLAGLPTLAEAGVPGYAFETWLGVFAPAGTAPSIVARVNGEIRKILALDEVRERLKVMGAEPVGSTPGEFASRLQADISTIGKIVRTSGMKVD
jgi:tripartite-type tricarboxylate transporter receptor subunit TctC